MATVARGPRWTQFPKPLAEVEQLFDQFFGPQNGGAPAAWRAPLSLWEDETHFHIEMEAPGLKRDDLELSVEKNILTIGANREKPAEGRNFWHDERRYGRIERKVSLPETTDVEAVEADLADGVLHVKLGKKPEAQPRKITINAAE
jgi:HSP20 family protein